MKLAARSLVFGCLIAFAAHAPVLRAQCGEWTPGFAAPGSPYLFDVLAFDSGAGEQLHGTGNRPTAGGFTPSLQRWNGVAWETLYTGVTSVGGYRKLAGGTVGGVHSIFVCDERAGLTAPTIVRWDGATATDLGSFTSEVRCLEVLDDGSGPALYLGTYEAHTMSPPTGYVAKWDGTAWSTVGNIVEPVASLAVFDAGLGPALHAGVGGTAGHSVRRFDGVTWQPVGGLLHFPVNDLEAWDFGAGPKLFAATDTNLFTWDGVSWTGASGLAALALHVADLGAGTRLFVAGGFSNANGVACFNIASFDGTTFAPLDGGIEPTGEPGMDLVSIPGSTPGSRTLCVRALMHRVDNPFPGLSGGLATTSLAAWDGANWSVPGHGTDDTVRAFAEWNPGTGDRLVVAGEFTLAGGSPSGPFGAGMWQGQWTPLAGFTLATRALTRTDLGSGPRLFGAGEYGGTRPGVLVYTGSGAVPLGSGVRGNGYALVGHDDGSGPRLFVGGDFPIGGPATAGNFVAAWDGASWSNLAGGMDGTVSALATYDEGGGERLFAGGAFTLAGGNAANHIARWDGAGWSALASGITNGEVRALGVFDGRLYAGGTFTGAGGLTVSRIARWNGSAWSNVPGGGANGDVLVLHVHDDGRGPALYVGGSFSAIGGISAAHLARFDGLAWEAVDGGLDDDVFALASHDDDGDGVKELFVGGAFEATATVASGHIARFGGCPHFEPICAGDGTFTDHTTPCPCGNFGAPGHGCAHSANANGALLAASGSTQLDTVVLSASEMPATTFSLYLQHSSAGDAVFHDGVICAGGPLLRLRSRTASGGANSFPDPSFAQDATLTLSQRGLVTPGSGATRYYSTFYRNASSTFCPFATANVTNGVRVLW